MDTDGFKLHKFKEAIQEEIEASNNNQLINLVEDSCGVLQEKKVTATNNGNANNDNKDQSKADGKNDKLFWSAYLQGMVRFLKLKLNSATPFTSLNSEGQEFNPNIL